MNLHNKVVLVTRPQHQAAEFIQLVEQNGGKAFSFPSIEIQSVEFDSSLKEIINKLNKYDMLIFISANAVSFFIELLHRHKLGPEQVIAKIAVIGKATYMAATKAGFNVDIQPHHGYNSEVLLEHAALQREQISARQVLIVRGRGGLSQLPDALMRRGADVDFAEVYQRVIPVSDTQIEKKQLSNNWLHFGFSDITVTSNESLQNLYDMLDTPGKNAMLNTHLVVPSKRCAELAKELGFQSFSVAQSATNQHMLEAISAI